MEIFKIAFIKVFSKSTFNKNKKYVYLYASLFLTLNKSVQLLNFMLLLQYVRACIHTDTYAISVELRYALLT